MTPNERYCKEVLGLEGDGFLYEGELYRLNFSFTGTPFDDGGTPFVVGNLLGDERNSIRLKLFLVQAWVCLLPIPFATTSPDYFHPH